MLLFYLSLIETEEDKSKFEILYYEYRERMFSAAFDVVENKEDAEDAVHNAFIGIANNIKSIDDPYSKASLSYVIKASKNSAINIYNKNNKIVKVEFDEKYYISDDEFFDSVFSESSYNEVVSAITNLKDTYKIPMYYFYVKELKLKEISKLLGVNLSTVKSRIYKGKKVLLEQLGVNNND